MDHHTCEIWNEITNPKISNDGKFIAYEQNPGIGDGSLILYKVEKGTGYVIPRAYNASFNNSSAFMVSKIKTPYAVTRNAKKEKKKKDEMPADSLLIYNLLTGDSRKFEDVSSYLIPEKGGGWFAFHHSYIPEKSENNNEGSEDKPTNKEIEKKFQKISKKFKLADLVILNPAKDITYRYENIAAYSISENGSTIIFQQLAKDSVIRSVVYSFDTEEEKLSVIFEGMGVVDRLCVDDPGKQSAFLFSSDTARVVGMELWLWENGMDRAVRLLDTLGSGLNNGWGANKKMKVYFSGNSDRLFLGTSPLPEVEKEDTLLKDEKASLDIWSWHDQYLQPMQKKTLEQDKDRPYLCFYSTSDKKFIQLGSENVETVRTLYKGNGDRMLGEASRQYGKFLSWEGLGYRDIYSIDPSDGALNKVIEKVSSTVILSPGGKYILYYVRTDSAWNSYNVQTGEINILTKKIGVNFYNEWNDVPQLPGPYGYTGFTQGDEYVLLNDRYDIWKIDPDGEEEPICLTAKYGRNNKIRLQYVRLDREEQYVDLNKDIYLITFNEISKEGGIARINMQKMTLPEQIYLSADDYNSLLKARDKDVFCFRKGNFKDYPDIYLSKDKFKSSSRISDANPQASDYYWGDVRLVNWVSFNGDQLEGLLYTPEDLDPSRKYPLLVYFYERSSDRLNRHVIPRPSRSIINIPWCTSNDYVVFVPDIIYRDGYPGTSAYDAVISGTQNILGEYSFIDRDNMGLQGQSWGGYQVAYLVTRTNLFKAAMAGAPVSNMTSAYGGIRWQSGMSRMFQYEKTQSRIGGTLWENLPLYIENSPVFSAPRIETPLLIMHNDNDGAVPWYQGIELFVALRRLEKPVWMLTYNNEEHNLQKWPNRMDLSIRMMQFFDFYLKGEHEPDWMKYGVPQTDKGKINGFSIIE